MTKPMREKAPTKSELHEMLAQNTAQPMTKRLPASRPQQERLPSEAPIKRGASRQRE
jgi:hypothetical protein